MVELLESRAAARRRFAHGALGAVIAFGPVLLTSCSGPAPAPGTGAGGSRLGPVTVERRLVAMGTVLTITVEAEDRPTALGASEAAVRAIEQTEDRLSTWRADSELSRIALAAEGTAVPLSAATAHDLARAFGLAHETGGAFDPTMGPLVAAWDLRGKGRIPGEAELQQALSHVGLDRFRWDLAPQGGAATLTKLDPQACLEEGAFGKGAGLDLALAALARLGVRRARIDLGGQVALLGDDAPHRVEIADPDRRDHPVVAIDLPAGSLATTGASERAIIVDGRRYHHVLDPRTGRPVRDFGSVSVWARSAFDADALSTAATVLGPRRALAWAASRPDLGLLVLSRVGAELRLAASPWLIQRITVLDPRVSIESDSFTSAPTSRVEASSSWVVCE